MIIIKTDGQTANVRIEVEGDDAFAYDRGDQVGEVTTTGEDDMDHGIIHPPKITYMHVEQEYRRNGIGIAMIAALANEFGALAPADRNIGIGGMNALTDEGERLTRRAQELGFVHDFPEEQPDFDDVD